MPYKRYFKQTTKFATSHSGSSEQNKRPAYRFFSLKKNLDKEQVIAQCEHGTEQTHPVSKAEIPHYDYRPQRGFRPVPKHPPFKNRVITLSLSLMGLSLAWAMHQSDDPFYLPQNAQAGIKLSTAHELDILPPLFLPLDEQLSTVLKSSVLPPQKIELPTSVSVASDAITSKLPEKTESLLTLEELLNNAATLTPNPTTSQVDDNWLKLKVKRGDNLSLIFDRLNLNRKQLHQLLSLKKHSKSLKRLYLGQKICIKKQDNGDIDAMMISINKTRDLFISRPDVGEKFKAKYLDKPIRKEAILNSVTINNSLFSDGKKAGIPYKLLFQLVEIFNWDVDFALDLKKGDHFTILYEEHYCDGEKVGLGKILAAQFTNNGKTYQAVRFIDKQGNTGYYTPEGVGMQKNFLRTPVKIGYISSGFNLKRRHPVLNRIRAHKGVDYAAPTGTPIYATSNGTVQLKGRKGGYGKTVILEHGKGMSTLYGHLSRYAKKLKQGQRVKQGQLIGYVGRTGLATGSHLHYEFRINKQHKNPLTYKMPATATLLSGANLKKFKRHSQVLISSLTQGQSVVQK